MLKKSGKFISEPELEKEKQILTRSKGEFKKLKQSAKKWVEKNLPENELQKMWKAHKTWLPRRYTVYKKQPTTQRIAIDTLARLNLVKIKGKTQVFILKPNLNKR